MSNENQWGQFFIETWDADGVGSVDNTSQQNVPEVTPEPATFNEVRGLSSTAQALSAFQPPI
jgi:hypothetical protein